MKNNSFSNGALNAGANANGPISPAAINPYTGTRLVPDHWWWLV